MEVGRHHIGRHSSTSWQFSALQPQTSWACCPDNTLQALQVVSFCALQEQGQLINIAVVWKQQIGLMQLTSPSLLSRALVTSCFSGAKLKPVAIGLISPVSYEPKTKKLVARTSAVHAGAERPEPCLRQSESSSVQCGGKLQPVRTCRRWQSRQT